MDGFGPHQDIDQEFDVAMEQPPLVSFDERRMHVRAYNYWVSLLGERTFPSIEDLDPEALEDFGPNSVILDFTGGVDDPVISWLGTALGRECGVDQALQHIRDVPARTVLSRLTDHYLQIIANEAPVGFEAEFTNQRGADVLYRGILMPFSSDDDTIDFVYGVINWKEVAAPTLTDDIARAVGALMNGAERDADIPSWPERHEPASPAALQALFELPALPEADLLNALNSDGEGDRGDVASDESAMPDDLDTSLSRARDAAVAALSAEGRGRQALYRAIGLAHGFALLAEARPDDYAALLADAGLAPQPRSPMTTLVKLVFGAGYDKTRLSEFAIAIQHAMQEGVEAGSFAARLTDHDGGLKAYVRDARAAKRGPAVAHKQRSAALRRRLDSAPAIALDAIATDADGLAVIVVRRSSDGSFEALGGVAGDDRRAAPFLRAVAGKA